MTARTTLISRRIASVVLAIALSAVAMLGVAHAATAPLTEMQVFSQPMGEVTMVQIMAAVDEGTTFPVETQIIIPAEFSVHAVTSFNPAEGTATGDPVEYTTEEGEDGELIYTLTLTEANGVNLLFNVEQGVYTEAGSHSVAGLALLAPSDLKQVIYAFAVPVGKQPSGADLVSFGQSADGSEVVGMVIENVKAGERPQGTVAFIDADGSGDATGTAAAGGGSSFLAGPLMYWLLGAVGVVLVAGVVALILYGRRQVVVADDVDDWDDDEE